MLVVVAGALLLYASDHSDAPHIGTFSRQDANITDLHAFVVGVSPNQHLVVALSTNPAIPPSATSYVFPTDVTFEVNIDAHSAVDAADPFGDGGTVADPRAVREDTTFRIGFREDGSAKVQRLEHGGRNDDPGLVSFFTGLRDDPFIRKPRDGRNSASIVLEMPLSSVARKQSTILLWATSEVDDFEGPYQDAVGRSLRSMFAENDALNSTRPKDHVKKLGVRPDVMIFDTSKPALYPNGRALTDDVVLRACVLSQECRVFNSEMRPPTPRANDVTFLATFPYLAPHTLLRDAAHGASGVRSADRAGRWHAGHARPGDAPHPRPT